MSERSERWVGAYCWDCAHTHLIGPHAARGKGGRCSRCACPRLLQAVEKANVQVSGLSDEVSAA